jgi:hypothetical protein
MSNSNIYKEASRLNLRFLSNKGWLSVEQLWEVPLINGGGFCLDAIAREVHFKLKKVTEGSFVEEIVIPEQREDELRLEILKDIIATKLEERKAKQDEKAKAQEKQRLLEILAKKKDSALEELSVEEIQKRIEAL